MAVLLIDERSGAKINLGDGAQTFPRRAVVVRDWEATRSRASTDQIYVEFQDGDTATCYPSVINAKVVICR
jgi:hypothetical protein